MCDMFLKNKLALTIILLLFSTCSYAQSYEIETLEGGKAKISVSCKAFSKRLLVSYLHSSLEVNDFIYMQEIKLVDKKFLQIDYGVRAGSGLIVRNTSFLTIKNNKLIVSFVCESYIKRDSFTFYELTAKFSIKENIKNSYTLISNFASKTDKKGGVNFNKAYNFKFSTKEGVFFIDSTKINKMFLLDSNNNNKTSNIYVNSMVKSWILYDNSINFYYEGKWYNEYSKGILLDYYTLID